MGSNAVRLYTIQNEFKRNMNMKANEKKLMIMIMKKAMMMEVKECTGNI